jgi:hypothetical protein
VVTPNNVINLNGGSTNYLATTTTAFNANWSGFFDNESGITKYEWGIGTTSNGNNIVPFSSVGLAQNMNSNTLTLTQGTSYYVVVRATNGSGLTVIRGSAPIKVDTTVPTAGTVRDGFSGADISVQPATDPLSANWSGFADSQSTIVKYEWAIGTAATGPNATSIQDFVSVGMLTNAQNAALTLTPGVKYYITVRATNGAGLTITKASNGVLAQ